MFEGLEAAIEGLAVAADERELLALLALKDRFDAHLSEAIALVDEAALWGADGSTSMAAWLRRHHRMTGRDAHEAVKASRIVRRCPAVRGAWQAGRISSGQVRVITKNVTEPLQGLFAEHEEPIVERLAELDVDDTTTVVQQWALRAKVALSLDGDLPEEPPRSLHLSPTLDGSGLLHANLDPEGHDVVKTALRLAESPDAEGEERTAAHRRADALVDVCRHFLDHQHAKVAGRHRPHVNVAVDLPHLQDGEGAASLGGLPVPATTMKRLLCDANLHRVITAGRSSILDYGRATRTIPPAVFTSLVLRDRHCRFPGCDRPPEWTEGHHILPWEEGGSTRLDNLVLLCSRHHHLIHHRDWHLKLLPSGVVEVTRPDGRVMTSDPPLLC